MQSAHFDHLLNPSISAEDFNPEAFADMVKDKTDNLPAGARTPTAEEMAAMKKFSKEYCAKHKKASQRQIRRAIQRKFRVQLLPNTGLK